MPMFLTPGVAGRSNCHDRELTRVFRSRLTVSRATSVCYQLRQLTDWSRLVMSVNAKFPRQPHPSLFSKIFRTARRDPLLRQPIFPPSNVLDPQPPGCRSSLTLGEPWIALSEM